MTKLLEWLERIFRWWVTVTPWESAIRVRWGKHVTVLAPGIHWMIPVIHKVFKQSTRLRYANLASQTLTTKDGKAVHTRAVIGYEIFDMRLLYEGLHHGQDALMDEAGGLVAESVAKFTSSQVDPEHIIAYILEGLDFMEYGIRVKLVNLHEFVYVRSYRFITGDGNYGAWGDALNTILDEAGNS